MKTVLAALAAVTALALSAPAHAVTYTVQPDSFDGSSGNFGHSGITSSFADEYDFSNIAAGVYDITLSTASKNLMFQTHTFDGQDIKFLKAVGNTSYYGLDSVSVDAGTQVIDIAGYYSGPNGTTGSYDGTVAFTVSGSPEPATWALMFLGLGGIGLIMRRARTSMGFRMKDAFKA